MKTTRRQGIWLVILSVSFIFGGPIARSQSGVTLTGIVTDQSGAIVLGASVRLYSTKRFRETKVGSDAGFEFTNVDPGKYEMEVTSPGFNKMTKDIEISNKTPRPITVELRVGQGGHCQVTELAKGSFNAEADIFYVKRVDRVDVKGLVRDDLGSPLAGVTVKLEGSGPSATTVSNGKGEFEFSNLEPGKYILASSLGGFRDISRYLWITQENVTEVTVTLPDQRRVGCFELSGPM
jgi:hypothetical protein